MTLPASLAQGLLSVGIAHATLRFYFDYKEQADRNAVVSTNLVATLGKYLALDMAVSLSSYTSIWID